ncbi:MAG: lipase family protein [Wolbachia endosymbiont of Tyrophagus putrescentiae]|nr:lipase family protein [Wolbachia endosymbiont of Tyrophagus putrescentiae]
MINYTKGFFETTNSAEDQEVFKLGYDCGKFVVEDQDIKESNTAKSSILDDFEVITEQDIGDINPPDALEMSISTSSLSIEESVAEIAGFNQEKLLEMCAFSKITYGNNDDKLSQMGYKTKEEFINEGYKIIPFWSNDERSADFVFAKGQEVTIAYHGTKDINDVLTDANATFTVPAFLTSGGRAHRGFYNAFKSSFISLNKVLEAHANEQKLEVKNLKMNFTGHSMGGALAKLAALCFNKTEGAQDVHVATFGDPRVFDLTASYIYNDALGEKTIRVAQHRQDPVPASPPGFTGYAHVGSQLRTEVPLGYCTHKIDGYYEAIKGMKESDFKSNNGVSLFYYPVKALQVVNCAVFGYIQSVVARTTLSYLASQVECKWYDKVVAQETDEPNTILQENKFTQDFPSMVGVCG